MTDMNIITGSLLVIYNDQSKLTDPLGADRVGSFIFGPNQEINYARGFPKGKITGDITFSDEKTFGTPFVRSKHYNVHVTLFTHHGYTDSTYKFKNEELLHQYIDLIEQATINNRINGTTLEEIRMEEEPFKLPDKKLHGVRYLFVFKDRK